MSQGSGYKKVTHDRRKGPKPRKFFDASGGLTCKTCFDLRNKNQILQEEVMRLRASLEKFSVGQKIPIGAHTPSSKIEFKVNSKEESKAKRGGAKIGHKGFGRSTADPEKTEIIDLPMKEKCETCECELKRKDSRQRTVIESVPIIAKRVIYNCPRGKCPICAKLYSTQPPVLKKSLYGNSLISQAAALHYFHGVTIGKVINIFGANVASGTLVDCFHRLGKIAEGAKPFLIEEYRAAQARHADETGWRTDGHSGYAWIFCTPRISIFEFRDTRSSRVAREILGTQQLKGVLNVDRYGGYNKMPVDLQYCYAHLLREVEKLEKDFYGNKEVIHFTSTFAVLLARSMKLRGLDISDKEYYEAAKKIKAEMVSVLNGDWQHLGIRKIQGIFHEKRKRLYHWVKDRDVAADNNRAERELRPTVIARKVSFGSQSDAGAKTRSSIMSLLYTVKKRLKGISLEEWLTDALNKISRDPNIRIESLIPQ